MMGCVDKRRVRRWMGQTERDGSPRCQRGVGACLID